MRKIQILRNNVVSEPAPNPRISEQLRETLPTEGCMMRKQIKRIECIQKVVQNQQAKGMKRTDFKEVERVIKREDFIRLIIVSLVGITIYQTLFMETIKYISATNTT